MSAIFPSCKCESPLDAGFFFVLRGVPGSGPLEGAHDTHRKHAAKKEKPAEAGFWLPDNVTDHEDGVRVLGDGFPLLRPMCGRFCTCDGLIVDPVRDSFV